MRARATVPGIVVAVLAITPVARAQEPEPPPEPESESESESAPAEETPADGSELTEEDIAWEIPALLVVGEAHTPDAIVQSVSRSIRSLGEVLSADPYVREARSRGLDPTGDDAFSALLSDFEVALVVVVERTTIDGEPHLRVTYREGRFGMVLLVEEHPLVRGGLPDRVHERILGEARLALAVVTRPAGTEAPVLPEPPVDRPPPEPGAAVHIGLGAALGMGTRSFELPSDLGMVRLGTSAFPSVGLRLRTDWEPTARGRSTFRGEVRYVSSIGLRTTEARPDGTNRQTGSRSQRIDLGLGFKWRLAEAQSAVELFGTIGWGFRLFGSEEPITLPDFSLAGPALAVGILIPVLDGRLEIGLGPEIRWIAVVSDELDRRGISGSVAVGGEASLRLKLGSVVSLEALYRESHALLTGGARDVERFGLLMVAYRP